ncbi:MAG: FAD binding domain-containing protein [Spirochaetaceae bacterium]|nr:FAD binding domain-containing protein [Spirochaetaceae bacterium]
MFHKYASPRVLFPRTINEALEMTGVEPDAVFWAGGTHLSRITNRKVVIDLPKVVISLGNVEELARASRSEHSLDIGAMMTLDRLASIGKSTLPAGLYNAITRIGNHPLRCRATIGGHLALRDRLGDLRPLLQLLETKIETRFLRERRGRRKPVSAIRKFPIALLEEKPGLSKGELITRISIPTENWNIGVYEKVFPAADTGRILIFTALARIEKNVLIEWRMAFSDGRTGVLRDRELEVDMAGRPLPLSPRELESLDEAVDAMTAPWENRIYERETAKSLARGFLNRAGG